MGRGAWEVVVFGRAFRKLFTVVAALVVLGGILAVIGVLFGLAHNKPHGHDAAFWYQAIGLSIFWILVAYHTVWRLICALTGRPWGEKQPEPAPDHEQRAPIESDARK
jgi:hypothetical protein